MRNCIASVILLLSAIAFIGCGTDQDVDCADLYGYWRLDKVEGVPESYDVDYEKSSIYFDQDFIYVYDDVANRVVKSYYIFDSNMIIMDGSLMKVVLLNNKTLVVSDGGIVDTYEKAELPKNWHLNEAKTRSQIELE